jgi:hypothetical protein
MAIDVNARSHKEPSEGIEEESVTGRQFHQEPLICVTYRQTVGMLGRVFPVKVSITRLPGKISRVNAPLRMPSRRMAQIFRSERDSMNDPSDGFLPMNSYRIAILKGAGELDVKISLEPTIVNVFGLLVIIYMIPKEKIERSRMASPRIALALSQPSTQNQHRQDKKGENDFFHGRNTPFQGEGKIMIILIKK